VNLGGEDLVVDLVEAGQPMVVPPGLGYMGLVEEVEAAVFQREHMGQVLAVVGQLAALIELVMFG
jgi:hypothetical protein